MIIAITGYIGSGKTTAAAVFKESGFEVINVDSLGHEILKSPQVRERIRAEFGLAILNRELEIDRKKLSKVVFNDTEKLKVLNKIVHPDLKAAIYKLLKDSNKKIVVDVALFNELNLSPAVQKIILITADIVNIYERLKSRYEKREILTIMNSQSLPRSPDYIVENNGSIEDLHKRIRQIISEL